MRTSALFMLALGLCLVRAPTSAADNQPNAGQPDAGQPDAGPSPELASQGKALYGQLCRNCHGVNMVNAGTSSFDLRKFPRDDWARFVNSVMNGKNSMPAWGDMLKPDEIEAIWSYVRTGGKT